MPIKGDPARHNQRHEMGVGQDPGGGDSRLATEARAAHDCVGVSIRAPAEKVRPVPPAYGYGSVSGHIPTVKHPSEQGCHQAVKISQNDGTHQGQRDVQHENTV